MDAIGLIWNVGRMFTGLDICTLYYFYISKQNFLSFFCIPNNIHIKHRDLNFLQLECSAFSELCCKKLETSGPKHFVSLRALSEWFFKLYNIMDKPKWQARGPGCVHCTFPGATERFDSCVRLQHAASPLIRQSLERALGVTLGHPEETSMNVKHKMYTLRNHFSWQPPRPSISYCLPQ